MFFLYVQFIICQVKKKEKKNKKKEDQEEEEEDAASASAAAKVCCNTQKAFHYFIFQDPLEPERNPIYCIIRQHHNQLTVERADSNFANFLKLAKGKAWFFR